MVYGGLGPFYDYSETVVKDKGYHPKDYLYYD